MYLCNSLKEDNNRLKMEVQQKNTEVEALNLEVEQLNSKYENLRFAKSFSGDSQNDMQEAKGRLHKLVQDVEKCIVLLKS